VLIAKMDFQKAARGDARPTALSGNYFWQSLQIDLTWRSVRGAGSEERYAKCGTDAFPIVPTPRNGTETRTVRQRTGEDRKTFVVFVRELSPVISTANERMTFGPGSKVTVEVQFVQALVVIATVQSFPLSW